MSSSVERRTFGDELRATATNEEAATTTATNEEAAAIKNPTPVAHADFTGALPVTGKQNPSDKRE